MRILLVLTFPCAIACGHRTYDMQGNMVAKDCHYQGGIIAYRYTYDNAGRMLTRTNTYTRDADLYRLTFDADGNVLTQEQTLGNGDRRRTVSTYDSAGNELSWTLSTNEKFYSRGEYTYDEDGRVSTAVHVDAEGRRTQGWGVGQPRPSHRRDERRCP